MTDTERRCQHAVDVFVLSQFGPTRAGLAASIQALPDFHVRREASTPADLATDGTLAANTIVVVDAGSFGNDEALASGLVELGLECAVLLVNTPSLESEADLVYALLGMRGLGVLDPTATADEMTSALAAVARGGLIWKMESIRHAAHSFVRVQQRAGALERLSDREQEVATLVAQGLTNKVIATHLDVAEGTVKAHVSHIMDKFGVENRVALATHILGLQNSG